MTVLVFVAGVAAGILAGVAVRAFTAAWRALQPLPYPPAGLEQSLQTVSLAMLNNAATYFDGHPDHAWTGREVAAELRSLAAHAEAAWLVEREFGASS